MTDQFHQGDPAVSLDGFAELIDRYQAFVLDQWGVLHDGNQLYAGVRPFLAELQSSGKEAVILTNSSKSSVRNIDRLATRFGLTRDQYGALISSADFIHDWLSGIYLMDNLAAPRSVFVLADEGDEQLLDNLEVTIVERVEDAEAVLVLSLPVTDTIRHHQEWMELAVRSGLPLVCPSNDLHTVRPDGVYAGMASIIGRYSTLGGTIHNTGKPEQHMFVRCVQEIGEVEPSRVLMVGDQIESDIVGARAQGWHTVLVASGAGRQALGTGAVRPDYLADSLLL